MSSSVLALYFDMVILFRIPREKILFEISIVLLQLYHLLIYVCVRF